MTITQQKLNISGLAVIAVLVVLFSRAQHPSHLIKFVSPETAPKATPLFGDFSGSTGTISGSVSLPSKSNAKQLSVCAVNADNHILYCITKVSLDFSINVPAGNYSVFSTTADNPYNLNSYRAYFTDVGSHTPKTITVNPGQTIADITPNDWGNKGDDHLIALIDEQQKTYMRYLAYEKAKQAAAEQITPAEQPVPNPISLDMGGVPDSEQQSIDSTQTAERHKNNN